MCSLSLIESRVDEDLELFCVSDRHEVLDDFVVSVAMQVALGLWVLVSELHAVLVVADLEDLNAYAHLLTLYIRCSCCILF